jgi:hypothetical protein
VRACLAVEQRGLVQRRREEHQGMARQRNGGGSCSSPPAPGPGRLDLGRGHERAVRLQSRGGDGGTSAEGVGDRSRRVPVTAKGVGDYEGHRVGVWEI